MFRLSSEMAVAMHVRSLPLKPTFSARARPCCRAVTMSPSTRIGTRMSPGTAGPRSVAMGPALLAHSAQPGQPLLQVQRGGHALEAQAHLDHRKGHVGL